MKEFMKKKSVKITKKVIEIIFMILFVGFILMVCLQRFSDNKLSFFNYRMFTVITGSMKPKYNIGDVLISKKTKPSKIKVGDTVSYLGSSGSFAGKVITHEVISIDKVNNKFIYHTKGLANIVEDPIISEDQLYGVVTHKCFLLSAIYKVVGTSYGLTIFIIIPLFYVIGSEMISMMLSKEEKRRSKLKKDKED